MMQMSLTGEIPLTRDNVLKVVREQGPIAPTKHVRQSSLEAWAS